MFKLFWQKPTPCTLTAPIDGVLIKLSDLSGTKKFKGFAIVPNEGQKIIRSPLTGRACITTKTKQAIVISSKNGIEIVIHIGVDTMNLFGDGFNSYTYQVQEVHQGQRLSRLSNQMVKKAGLDTAIMIIFVKGYEQFHSIKGYGSSVKAGEVLMKCKR